MTDASDLIADLSAGRRKAGLVKFSSAVDNPAAQQDAVRRWAFGRLIGNTDMHAGNLAFLHTGGPVLELAPAYDMLPMALAPRASGEAPATLHAPLIGTPPALDAWRVALLAAGAYWESVATDLRIDEPVRNAARAALASLEEFKLPLA